jgi:hypothetical protein
MLRLCSGLHGKLASCSHIQTSLTLSLLLLNLPSDFLLVECALIIQAKVKRKIVDEHCKHCQAEEHVPHEFFIAYLIFLRCEILLIDPNAMTLTDPVAQLLLLVIVLTLVSQLSAVDLVKHVVHVTEFNEVQVISIPVNTVQYHLRTRRFQATQLFSRVTRVQSSVLVLKHECLNRSIW